MRVAGYCRVSTDQADQANSFDAQQRYFRDYIQQHPNWSLHEIYADEGITGTSTKKRTQFNRMIQDAYEGKFSLILTKEVSRFSRNILDTISYTRELRSIGVGVLFVTDRIHTMEPESEMLLSFLASLAQEESRRTSTRVVWGQTRQMEQGVVFGRSLLGYDVKDGKISINPEGAELVRLIFHKYAVQQVSTSSIARYLTEQGYRTQRGRSEWKSNTITKILNNEKYVGDLVQKKTYTPDYLTHEKRPNKGQVPMVRIDNHHEPIISRELWDLAQERLQRNHKHRSHSGGHSNRYGFSGKIQCGQCGAVFVRRQKRRKNGTVIPYWSCSTAASRGVQACNVGKLLRDEDAMIMLKTAIRNLIMDASSVVQNVTILALEALLSEEHVQDDPRQLRYRVDSINRKKEAMMDSYFAGHITKEEMLSMKGKYAEQIALLHTRITRAEQRKQENRDVEALKKALSEKIHAILMIETESMVFCKAMVKNLTVYADRHMELRLNHLDQVFSYTC